MTDATDPSDDWPSRHLWQFKVVQDIFWIALAVALLWFGYYLRSVFVPILIGLGLAYVVNPLLSYVGERWKLPRVVTISIILGGLTTMSIGVVAFLSPIVINELQTLSTKLPGYVDTLASKVDASVSDPWSEELKQLGSELPGDGLQLAKYALDNTGAALGIVSDVVSSTVYILLSLCLIPIYFFFFAWHFNPMLSRAKSYLPESRRGQILDVLGQMDQAVGAFLRGRLLVMVAMMVMFSLGFWIAGVPYWFLLGSFTGLLSFIPYVAVVGCVLAVAVKWIDASTGSGGSFDWVSVFVFPILAYGVVQLLEGWVLTPWIQSKSMEMNPVAILIVVLIGGSVGGLYGLLLAIPLAACSRIMTQELLLPKLERWADDAT